MANHFGNHYHIQIFGQSHAPSIGAVIEGLPAGFKPDWEQVMQFMSRRAPGQDDFSTRRKESDMPEILSGLNEKGEICGAPLAIRIQNSDHHSADYDKLRDLPRPGHADFSAYTKFSGFHDIRGGGQFSGRLTAPICFAGALALQLLKQKGVLIAAHIASIADVQDTPFDPVAPDFTELKDDRFTVLDAAKGAEMKQRIADAAKEDDSVGGIIECCAIGLPAGLGDPMFDGVENRIAQMLFAIPAVRGVEFGTGFAAASMTGSCHNDPFVIENNTIKTSTNHHGGVLGGITTGMPLIIRMAVKPTPSIARKQRTISINQMAQADLTICGRHDPCIVPRAVPVMEAVVACVLYDLLAD